MSSKEENKQQNSNNSNQEMEKVNQALHNGKQDVEFSAFETSSEAVLHPKFYGKNKNQPQ